jgi:hypothetical protein
MNANVTALVVAIVGVAGTLLSAFLGQRYSMLGRQLELRHQREERHEERDERDKRANLTDRRDSYISLNSAARAFRQSLKNYLFAANEDTAMELERTRRDFLHRYAEAQLIAHHQVLNAAHQVSAQLADTYGQLKKLDAARQEGRDLDLDLEGIGEKLNTTDRAAIHLLQDVMRDDVGAAH